MGSIFDKITNGDWEPTKAFDAPKKLRGAEAESVRGSHTNATTLKIENGSPSEGNSAKPAVEEPEEEESEGGDQPLL